MTHTLPHVSLSRVTKKIGKSTILSDITLSLEEGEVFGFLGPNGAGKTTTMKAILGIIESHHWKGRALRQEPSWDLSVKKRIGFMPENTYLYKYLTADEFLDFNGKFYDLSKEVLEIRKQRLLEKVGLSHARNKKLNTYSKVHAATHRTRTSDPPWPRDSYLPRWTHEWPWSDRTKDGERSPHRAQKSRKDHFLQYSYPLRCGGDLW
jgi:ATPase subunit of ABC transporter with duplicated ATPase domains